MKSPIPVEVGPEDLDRDLINDVHGAWDESPEDFNPKDYESSDEHRRYKIAA